LHAEITREEERDRGLRACAWVSIAASCVEEIHRSIRLVRLSSGTFCILFSVLRRFVYLVRRGAGRRRSCIQFTLRSHVMQDVNSAFSPDQSVLNFYSTTARLQRADVSPAYAAPPSLFRYTDRPFGHQWGCTQRLTIFDSKTIRSWERVTRMSCYAVRRRIGDDRAAVRRQEIVCI